MDPNEYTDTGLGWFARTSWLVQNAITLATLTEITGGVVVPYSTSSGAEVDANGLYVHTYEYAGGDVDQKAVCVTSGANVVAGRAPSGNGYQLKFAGDVQNAVVEIWNLDRRGGGSAQRLQRITLGYQWRPGLWVFSGPTYSMGSNERINTDIPVFNTEYDFFNQVAVQQMTFSKVTPGYAVATLAKWKTSAGVTITTPVLISSNSEFTDMETNMPKLNIMLMGLRFYMSFFDVIGKDYQTSLQSFDKSGQDDNPLTLEQVFHLIASGYYASINVYNSPDPYSEEGGASGEEGGDGDSDPEDNPVEEETLPIPSVTGLGFSTVYVPTAADLSALAQYLWGGNLDLNNFLRLFANPMDSILGLSAVPVVLSGTYEPIYLGGQLLQGITMPRYSGRTAVKVDMGTATISKRWGSYLDYDPYTEFAVYLPFIGIKNIKADDIMDKTISLMYNIDILSGACVAYIRTSGGSVLYEWAGQCAMQIPITGANWDNIFSTAISTAVTLGGAMAAPASAPMLAGSVASAAVQAVAAKPRVERSGAVTGVTGFLGQLRPYIIRTIPEAYIPADQNKFIGYPAYINVDLSNVSGYNEVDSIHLENVTATGTELEEIESILKGGVIF